MIKFHFSSDSQKITSFISVTSAVTVLSIMTSARFLYAKQARLRYLFCESVFGSMIISDGYLEEV